MSTKNSKSTLGAWLLHHDQKLQNTNTTEFESIVVAGRSTRLLSVISQENETTISKEHVNELARGIGVREIEVGGFLNKLNEHGLIDIGTSGIGVLGVSQVSLLDHATDIFEAQSPQGIDHAVIELAERGSHTPLHRKDCGEEISDIFKLTKHELNDVFRQSEHIGFIDYEMDGVEKLYFNGSLFRRDSAAKSKLILQSLSTEEQQKLGEAESSLNKQGCILADELRQILGAKLWSKLHQIGFLDVSVVSNERGSTEFVSKPGALAKYIPNGLVDILDDAKALASSLMYGIIKSHDTRGRIKDPSVLIDVLISRGYVEGWASAIKRDYQVLERRGVVKVTTSELGNRLTLLKPEVGKMARDLILSGDASTTAAEVLVGSQAIRYYGPENSRVIERKKEIPETKVAASRSLNILRKG